MFDVLYGRLPNNEVTNRVAEGVIVISDRNQLRCCIKSSWI